MARFFREDFDRNRDFVVARDFTFAGQRFVSGSKVIDKNLFTLRRLRQLYDMRNLAYAPSGTTFVQPEVAPKVERYRPKIERRRLGVTNAVAS
jgi:hypothetical protein